MIGSRSRESRFVMAAKATIGGPFSDSDSTRSGLKLEESDGNE